MERESDLVSTLIRAGAFVDEKLRRYAEVIFSAFFPLTNSIESLLIEIEHRRFDAIPGANLSPTFLSRDLPLFRECTPARREARWNTVEPTYEHRRG